MSPTASKQQSFPLAFSTKTIHCEPDAQTGAVVPPLCLSSTFTYKSVTKPNQYEYARDGNPNRNHLEEVLGSLEDGQPALCYASGSAATAAAIQSLGSGAHILLMEDVYSGTSDYVLKIASENQLLQSTFLDLVESTDQEIYDAIKENTKLIWIESPTNPTLRIVSVPRLVRIAKSHPSKPLVLIDSTFASPYFTNPISQGVDIVLHSVTKYINGHSDVLMGALIVRKGLDDVFRKLKQLQVSGGYVPSPFDCYLTLRGLKTLSVRALQHGRNALAISRFLSTHPAVEKATYPGLSTHAQQETVKASLSPQVLKDLKKIKWDEEEEGGVPFGGVVSFRIKGGAEAAGKFLLASKLFALAESLGGVESLAEVAAQMSHHQIPEEERLRLGITPDLIRMSVGIEDVDDLIRDIDQALEVSQRV
ncbi:Cys/Met metabolism PLP-dependent enzyme-domain-containing protein [Mrakia frigida]|uniref:trans-sulfuration enzyme family protein n=1 Tax=Mrakia frigida TaxID=29902 RepID=UPI003FCC0C8F